MKLSDKAIYILLTVFVFLIMVLSIEFDSAPISTYISAWLGGFPPIEGYSGTWEQWYYGYPGDFENFIIFGTVYLQIVVVIFAATTALIVFNREKTIHKMEYYRTSRYLKTIRFRVATISLKVSFSIFLGYMIYFLLALLITRVLPADEVFNMTRTIFTDWFGEAFYYHHRHLYFLVEGVLRFFVLPFIFSLLFGTIAVMVNRISVAVVVPLFYYFTFTAIGYFAFDSSQNLGYLLNPLTIMVSGSFYGGSTENYLSSLLIPIMIPIILLTYQSRVYEL